MQSVADEAQKLLGKTTETNLTDGTDGGGELFLFFSY
jgi:hypothetical protein